MAEAPAVGIDLGTTYRCVFAARFFQPRLASWLLGARAAPGLP